METTSSSNNNGATERPVSRLGTKIFWNERYKLELQNFEEHGDEGEVWFGKSAEDRTIKYLLKTKLPLHTRIIDLGSGNGSMLRRLRKRGFTCLMGVDYCEEATTLARFIAEKEEKAVDTVLPKIHFQTVDLLEEDLSLGAFEVVLDKGTWDAMSLSEEYEKRLYLYRALVDRILANNGIFVIFSCNYIREELCQQFGIEPLRFEEEIPAEHSFSFGGKQGVTSTGIVFRKM